MESKHYVIFIIGMLLFSCVGQNTVASLDFLAGTWQIEGKDTFEKWALKDGQLHGYSYTLKEGKEYTSETLVIRDDNGSIVYEATVMNQNDGKAIPFILKTADKDTYSFENPEHDFPKKIQYIKVNNAKLLVHVLGEGDKGFSYYLLKQ